MRGLVAFAAFALAAGCAQPAGVADERAPEPDFSRYVQCAWRNETVRGTCDNGVGFEGELVVVEQAVPPPGWLCFHWLDEPEFPFWKMGWSPHRAGDGTGIERWLGFHFDASPHQGPIDGWFVRFSDATAPKLWHFASPSPSGFIEFPDDVVEDEIQYQMVLLPARGQRVADYAALEEAYKAAPGWTAARNLFVADGVPAPWPEGGILAWERHEPVPGWWKVLRPTFAMEVPQGLAYFPLEPADGYAGHEQDPSMLAGSGHWSTVTGRLYPVNESGPGWSLGVRLTAIADLDGHQEDFTNPAWQFLCGCPDETILDQPDWLLCQLGVPPPIVDGNVAHSSLP